MDFKRFLLLSKNILVKSLKRTSCHLVTGFVIYKRGDNKDSCVSDSLKVLIHGLLKLVLEVKLIRGIAATYQIYRRRRQKKYKRWKSVIFLSLTFPVSSCAHAYCV